MTRTGVLRSRRLFAAVAAAGIVLTGCTNTGEDDAASSASTGGGDGQVVRDTEDTGEGCTLEQYGAEPLELEGAVVGFSQSEPDTAAFRAAETESIRAAADEVGVGELLVTNADNELPKQIADIQDLLNRGVELLLVAPVNSDGLDPALDAAKAAGVPVITIDRKVTNTPCEDYVAFLGSDFYDQGARAADAMSEAAGGEAQVAILLGSSGNNVTDDRNAGFKDQVEAEHPGLEIVAEQTANFARDEGQAVAEQLLQSNPDITAIYAHNDEMALGAVTAVQSAGLQPGVDVTIVSIDGTRNAVQAIVDGQINAVIESNPRFGPLAFETAQRFYDGETIPEDVIIEDDQYDSENAEADLGNAF
ncbi:MULTISPECIES: ABC transporter substrate-binding protein [Actinoalloteichus]|uniref:Monosaccharide ABC transporter substrate-binding protein, CUT2 family n=1 Tax=Actinoalloteichus fjordicus TaxID=1612552 RepID=A0AAC9LD04_9PSEU|nr:MULTISPECIES: ABC transporter substrate-binding protein [Actinoalloteichus]APU15693.1 monosaccharide ABC transporter substrate-binding protein, CUT2 family [Actinoalloteichus fjordicus]APU21753.1 monosaccharide ABC transporter substrate-binding protein, CUT2 family [Actinoalloteichus sp. GBA129-24]